MKSIHKTYHEKMKEIIHNLTEVIDGYVFSDIIQNPPNSTNMTKVNLTKELSEVFTDEQRPYYEFYRDVKRIVAKATKNSP